MELGVAESKGGGPAGPGTHAPTLAIMRAPRNTFRRENRRIQPFETGSKKNSTHIANTAKLDSANSSMRWRKLS